MKYTVRGSDLSKLSLGEKDKIKSILQNIAVILRTRAGTCPMYRNFGLPQKYIGLPSTAARPIMYAEIREAIEEFEPRVDVMDISFEQAPSGVLIPTVEVRIH